MMFEPSAVGATIKDEVLRFVMSAKVDESGRVYQVGDGIARVIGLENAVSGELLEFENGVQGIAMNLEEDNIAAVLLGKDTGVNEGDFVTRTGKVAHIPVGDMLLGRVVNALGAQIDQKGDIMTQHTRPIERIAPGVLARKSVTKPLLTGIKSIDAMVPIGRGQRQLIIGDRQTGKTAIAIDAIINQRGKGVNCIYVAVGQKNSTVSGIVNTLSEHEAMRYTAIIVAGASEAAPLQYLAPYSGCAVAEYWMEQGKDVLIVFDDLSKHAVAYRTMSLLMQRPPGREAYPGDVFYLHSRLLERAGCLSDRYGGGSLTALPIIETQGGDMSAYIPTNVISITDGQIYLETESFNAGIRPAINPGLSVSRVGGAAQVKAMKDITAPIRTDLAQYRELASFAQFSSDLDKETKDRLRHGERIVEVLKQRQYMPMALEYEILVLLAVTRHCMDDINVEDVPDFESELVAWFNLWHAQLLGELRGAWEIGAELEAAMLEGIGRCKAAFAEAREAARSRSRFEAGGAQGGGE
ncbi:MAG: F0F1 ATP synthase subunit alpha [Clostridiales bacterium]|jgi:F-type H+-transporting ATPase subunit alpha|nr:F0F1 ATP synthase subunit alpha [Clostridiales bacterium]